MAQLHADRHDRADPASDVDGDCDSQSATGSDRFALASVQIAVNVNGFREMLD
jgi:hypothetical protein